MKLTALTYTSPDWMALDNFISRACGISPIRYFDENKITPGSVYSHIIALELFISQGKLRPTRLGLADRSLNHISLTFALECDSDELEMFQDLYAHRVTILSKVDRYEVWFVLLTLTLKELKTTILRHCSRKSDKWHRVTYNAFYNLLQNANLGELFEYYEIRDEHDGTFSIEE